MNAYRVLACGLGLLAVPAAGLAQDRVRVSVNAGQQTSASTVGQTGVFEDFLEDATFTADHEIDADVFYDGGLTIRIAGGFMAGLAVSYFSGPDATAVQAALPHPFFFEQPRSVSGESGGLKRTETGVHILFGWVAGTDRVEVMVTAGPSILKAEQDLVERIEYTHAYPFDEAQFTGVARQRVSETAAGFNVGADVTWRFARNVGLGGLIRYSHGTVDGLTVAGSPVSFDVGGLHAGGGLRFVF
jgi:hypothetical protein